MKNRQCIKECQSSEVPVELEKIFADWNKSGVANTKRRLNSVLVELGHGVLWYYWEDGKIFQEILTYDDYMDMIFIYDFIKYEWQAEFYPGGTTWYQILDREQKKLKGAH